MIQEHPYEIHVTVRTGDIAGFKSLCGILNVKPIVIELDDRDGVPIMSDVMASVRCVVTEPTAYGCMRVLAADLKVRGFEPVRMKLETTLDHPRVQENDGYFLAADRYFESHVPVRLSGDAEERGRLAAFAVAQGVHLSRNAFKKLPDGGEIVMLTKRSRSSDAASFKAHTHLLMSAAERRGFMLDPKVEIEFCIFDSKVRHDAAWIAA